MSYGEVTNESGVPTFFCPVKKKDAARAKVWGSGLVSWLRYGLATKMQVNEQHAFGLYSGHYSVLIVRGIGFRIIFNRSDFETIFLQINKILFSLRLHDKLGGDLKLRGRRR